MASMASPKHSMILSGKYRRISLATTDEIEQGNGGISIGIGPGPSDMRTTQTII